MEKLREYIAESGLSQAAFARKIEVCPQHFNKVFHLREPASSKLARRIERETKGAIKWYEVLDAFANRPEEPLVSQESEEHRC